MLLLHKNSLRESLESYFGILGAYLFIASDSNLSKESFHLFFKKVTCLQPFSSYAVAAQKKAAVHCGHQSLQSETECFLISKLKGLKV